MTDAAIGYGTTFEIEAPAGSGTYVTIAEITDLTPPDEKADVIDATNMQSPGGYKEKILGLTDPGQLSVTMNLVPGSLSEITLLAAKASRLARNSKITYPNGSIWSFAILITGYQTKAPVQGKMEATVTGDVSGAIART
jgi:predicted secreted protein